MRLVLSLSAMSLALAACAPIVTPVATPQPPVVIVPSTPVSPLSSAARASATTVVNREMAKRLPGVNVAPYTACVVNNATMAELADLSGMVSGNDAGAASAVAAIVRRPATTSCIAGVARTV